jgi:hypothetical protein
MGDRLDLQRIGNHHPRHIRRQNPRHGHAVAGRLDHHFVGGPKALAEAFQRRARHVDPASIPKPAVFPDHHLAKGAVGIDPDHTSHPCLLSVDQTGAAGDTTTTDSRSRRNRASRRGGQLLTRARSSSCASACPHLRAPGASVPDGRTIRRDLLNRSWTSAPEISYRLPTSSKARAPPCVTAPCARRDVFRIRLRSR